MASNSHNPYAVFDTGQHIGASRSMIAWSSSRAPPQGMYSNWNKAKSMDNKASSLIFMFYPFGFLVHLGGTRLTHPSSKAVPSESVSGIVRCVSTPCRRQPQKNTRPIGGLTARKFTVIQLSKNAHAFRWNPPCAGYPYLLPHPRYHLGQGVSSG